MTVQDFLNKLVEIEVKIETISAVYHSFVYEFNEDVLNYDKEIVNNVLKNLSVEEFAAFGIKLGRCLSECREEQKHLAEIAETDFAQKAKKIEILIEELVNAYYSFSNSNSTKKDNTLSAIEQHEKYLEEVKLKLKDLNNAVVNANELIDDKIFTLLINTVAILGIFVAIAFAGFGVTSIFSNINFSQACLSYANLIKAVFFLILTSLLSYNLLLLLVYFIFKLSRPLIIRAKKDKDGNEAYESFNKSINLTPFLWIDFVLLSLSIIFFVWSICL